MSEFCPRCKREMRQRYRKGHPKRRKPTKSPASTAKMFGEIDNTPIDYTPEYRKMVHGILQEKRKRDVIADIKADQRTAAGQVG